MTTYHHTQRAPLHLLLHAVAVAMLVSAWFSRHEAMWVTVLLAVFGVLMSALAFAFQRLSVSDEGDMLAVEYGPLPLFRKRIAYDQIVAVEPGKSSFVDGWGIHYVPGHGWTYNLWGYDCVKLTLADQRIQVGTDEPEILAEFLQTKIRQVK